MAVELDTHCMDDNISGDRQRMGVFCSSPSKVSARANSMGRSHCVDYCNCRLGSEVARVLDTTLARLFADSRGGCACRRACGIGAACVVVESTSLIAVSERFLI